MDPETKTTRYSNAEMTALAIKAMEDDAFRRDRIELLACGTSSPDQLVPSHTTMVHGELQSPPCEVGGVSGICCSGIYAIKYGYLSILSGEHKTAVATGSELLSSFMGDKNFNIVISGGAVEELDNEPINAFESAFLRWMLSDGAGAMLLSDTPASGGLSLKIEWIDLRSYAGELETCMYAGARKMEDGSIKGWREFPLDERNAKELFAFKQDVGLLNGNMSRIAIKEHLKGVAARYGLKAEAVDYFLPHLSSFYFKDEIHRYMGEIGFDIPLSKWFTNLGYVGNIGAAAIFVMLEELMNEGVPVIDEKGEITDRTKRVPLQKGQKLLCGIPESGRFTNAFMLLTVV
jgi:3-oxoacyl-[acyl-carrier-protein] synthase-3